MPEGPVWQKQEEDLPFLEREYSKSGRQTGAGILDALPLLRCERPTAGRPSRWPTGTRIKQYWKSEQEIPHITENLDYDNNQTVKCFENAKILSACQFYFQKYYLEDKTVCFLLYHDSIFIAVVYLDTSITNEAIINTIFLSSYWETNGIKQN